MVVHTKISKREFKENCDFHVYGYGANKHNVICFDHNGKGFKYAVALAIENGTKKELFDRFYDWVCNSIALPYYVRYKFAVKDEDRFKVPLSLNF